jgi:hypothetical protein
MTKSRISTVKICVLGPDSARSARQIGEPPEFQHGSSTFETKVRSNSKVYQEGIATKNRGGDDEMSPSKMATS